MSNPLAQQDRSGLPATEASRDPFSIPTEVKASIRVLVVDDERTLRESCASVLQMDGYNVTLVGRGEEALDTVKRRKFDIILVDLYMSQASGLDILRSTLQAYKDTIVVVMTGNPSVTSSIEALRAAWLDAGSKGSEPNFTDYERRARAVGSKARAHVRKPGGRAPVMARRASRNGGGASKALSK